MEKADDNFLEIFQKIIHWYQGAKRPLPWRLTKNPYHQLVAEFIFQQTRIIQGIEYYQRIIEKYPTIDDLAKASEKEFLKDWQGLGYYGRAHRLLELAKIVVEHYHSNLPSSQKELLKLPGIGPYTPAILASQWSNEKVPAIDGNVKRVIARIFAITKPMDDSNFLKEVDSILKNMIVYFDAGEFNESMMELGALVCTPRQPLCSRCPVHMHCKTYKNQATESFPVPAKAKTKPLWQIFYIVKTDEEGNFFMHARKNTPWKGFYEFPQLENASQLEKLKKQAIFKVKHELTHRKIEAYFLKNIPLENTSSFEKIPAHSIFTIPVHVIVDKFLKSEVFKKLYLTQAKS
jgi:A/G-specific adenine glycosylase